jgi:hypothetical protein
MASTTIAFVGTRMDVTEDEVHSLEDRSHPAIVQARKGGLDFYWGNFESPNERYFLFIGKRLGKFGLEDLAEVQIPARQLGEIQGEVARRFEQAGISASPMLIVQFQPDA